MIGKTEWRLRTTLVVLLCFTMLATLATLLITGSLLYIWRIPEVRQEQIAQVRHEAEQLAARMEIQLGGLQRQLELAGATLVQLPRNPPRAILDALTAGDQSFDAVYLADPDGNVETVSFRQKSPTRSSELLGSDLSANRLYRLALQRGSAVWSNKFLSVVSGTVTVGIAVPLGSRVLIGELSLAELLSTLRTASKDSKLLVWVIDGRGELVAEIGSGSELGATNLLGLPLVQAALEGSPLPDTVTIQGGDFHPAVAHSTLLDWFFLLRMQAGLTNPDIRYNATLVGIALLSSLLIGMLLAPFAARWISNPVHAITVRARQVADGKPSGSWPRGPISEINVLAADLESMSNHLQEHNDQFRAIFNASPVPMGVVDGREDCMVVDINDAWVRQFRRDREETIGRSTRDLQLWVNESDVTDIMRSEPVAVTRYEVSLLDAEQHPLLCEISARPVIIGGKTYAIWVIEDITARKRAEQNIRTALADREVLLKEIYHRVKNNLQVVSSLLNLQSRRATEMETKRLLGESANRVNSIALVHEQLYRTENLSSIVLPEYMRQLADNLINVNHPKSTRVQLRIEVDDLFVGIESAIPLGLIVNELVSNAYRHGYADNTAEGKISVRVIGLAGGEIRLEVEDDGQGLPTGFNLEAGGGLGVHLVIALAQQLGGELKVDACPSGARFVLLFKPQQHTT